jgi:hypothetical protein
VPFERVDRQGMSSYVDDVKSEVVLTKLVRKYGIRRAMTLLGAAAVVAQRGNWDSLVAPDGYTRQGVWTWKRDLEEAGVDPFDVEWSGFEKRFGADVGEGLARAKERIRERRAGKEARDARGKAAT